MREMFKGVDFYYYERNSGEYLIIDLDDAYIVIEEYMDEDEYDYGIANWKIYKGPFKAWEDARRLNDEDFFWDTVKDNWPTFYRMIVDIIFEEL